MPAFSVTVDGTTETVLLLGRFEATARKEISRVVQRSTLNIHRRARRRLTEEKAVDTGRALASISWIRVGLDGLVSVDVEYGKYIEFGTAPHFPPPAALAGWARRHGMAGMEFVIARHIAQVGTPARPFLYPSYMEEIPVFQAALSAAVIAATRAG